MPYRFYGSETPAVRPITKEYAAIRDQRHLYDLLSDIWCEYSCAPRLRPEWSESNKTLGQCSVTAFLVQDIFGGEVYGIPLEGGGFHCYNSVDGVTFDLTSEQFGDKKLTFDCQNVQSREEHFVSKEKYERYLYLKRELIKALSEK
ncbi:MAG: hypothetical protein IJU10_04565 [Clostridia bacterium]|nr:hypothetical protein [Clostridia bacterium]